MDILGSNAGRRQNKIALLLLRERACFSSCGVFLHSSPPRTDVLTLISETRARRQTSSTGHMCVWLVPLLAHRSLYPSEFLPPAARGWRGSAHSSGVALVRRRSRSSRRNNDYCSRRSRNERPTSHSASACIAQHSSAADYSGPGMSPHSECHFAFCACGPIATCGQTTFLLGGCLTRASIRSLSSRE